MKTNEVVIGFIGAVVLSLFAVSASANCVGTSTFSTCTEPNGNTYQVQRFGNTTQLNGFNSSTGSTWNQTSQSIGNMTINRGTAGNGQSWNTTTHNYGNGNSTTYGTDSTGRSVYCTTIAGQTNCH